MTRMLPLAVLALACIAAPALAAEEVAKIGDASVALSAEAMVAAAAPTVSAFAVTVLSGLASLLLARDGLPTSPGPAAAGFFVLGKVCRFVTGADFRAVRPLRPV